MTTHASTSPNRFAEHVRTAIEAAPLRDLDGMASKLWAAHGAGIIGDDQAQELQETIQQRRRPQPVAQSLLSATPIVAPRYYIQRSPEQRSPDRAASIARRRRLALSGLMPPQLGDRFTVGELAVLKIVADEFLAHGVCDLSRNAIAARAGVSHSLAKRALLLAESEDVRLISVERRPRSGRKHLANLTRIVDRDWLAWLAHGNRKEKSIKSCTKARPDFKTFRGVKNYPPRSQILRNSGSNPVDKTVKKRNRTGASRA